MISQLRKKYSDEVSHFEDYELAYILGWEHISFNEATSVSTLWKLRSWAKYEDYVDAVEIISDDGIDFPLTDDFYEMNGIDRMDAARDMLIKAGLILFVNNDTEVWVKRTDWKN